MQQTQSQEYKFKNVLFKKFHNRQSIRLTVSIFNDSFGTKLQDVVAVTGSCGHFINGFLSSPNSSLINLFTTSVGWHHLLRLPSTPSNSVSSHRQDRRTGEFSMCYLLQSGGGRTLASVNCVIWCPPWRYYRVGVATCVSCGSQKLDLVVKSVPTRTRPA